LRRKPSASELTRSTNTIELCGPHGPVKPLSINQQHNFIGFDIAYRKGGINNPGVILNAVIQGYPA
jgi:hypothetical protein